MKILGLLVILLLSSSARAEYVKLTCGGGQNGEMSVYVDFLDRKMKLSVALEMNEAFVSNTHELVMRRPYTSPTQPEQYLLYVLSDSSTESSYEGSRFSGVYLDLAPQSSSGKTFSLILSAIEKDEKKTLDSYTCYLR